MVIGWLQIVSAWMPRWFVFFLWGAGGSDWSHKDFVFLKNRCGHHIVCMFITCWLQILKCSMFKWLILKKYLSLTGYWIWRVIDLCLFLACSTMLCITSTIIQLKLDRCLCGGSCQLSRIEKILFKKFQNQSLDILVSKNVIWQQIAYIFQSMMRFYYLKKLYLISMWQLATWGSAKCMEKRVIHREPLLRLQFGKGQEWKTFVPCLFKYTESHGTLMFDPTLAFLLN
jgi:hypothetical protein